jgi:hypothetical protein
MNINDSKPIANQIPKPRLILLIHNELVMPLIAPRLSLVNFPQRHAKSIKLFIRALVRRLAAMTLGGVLLVLFHELFGIGVGGGEDIHLAEGALHEEDEVGACVAAPAVHGAFLEHVGQVDAFAEQVAAGRGLGGRDPQALAQDAHEVGHPRPVPEQQIVAELQVELFLLIASVNFKDVLDFGLVVAFGVVDVGANVLVDLLFLVHWPDLAVQFGVVLVQDVGVSVAGVQQLGSDFHVRQGLEHVQFELDFLLRIKYEIAHIGPAEIVRDKAVKLRGKGIDLRLILTLNRFFQLSQHFISILDSTLSQLAQRHLLRIIANLLHRMVDLLGIENQVDQLLHPCWQLAAACFCRLGFGCLCGLLILLVVGYGQLGIAPVYLLVSFLVVLVYGHVLGKRPLKSVHARLPDSAPPLEDEELAIGLIDQALVNIKFIIVFFDIALIQRATQSCSIRRMHSVFIRPPRHQPIDHRPALGYHLDDVFRVAGVDLFGGWG